MHYYFPIADYATPTPQIVLNSLYIFGALGVIAIGLLALLLPLSTTMTGRRKNQYMATALFLVLSFTVVSISSTTAPKETIKASIMGNNKHYDRMQSEMNRFFQSIDTSLDDVCNNAPKKPYMTKDVKRHVFSPSETVICNQRGFRPVNSLTSVKNDHGEIIMINQEFDIQDGKILVTVSAL